MSTKFTKPIVINAPGKDIVFDGIDFTEEATIEITAAASVTFKNCRFYNVLTDTADEVQLIGNLHQAPKAAGYKLIIERCYFGNNGVYNMVNVGQTMLNGSRFNQNYCTNDCSKDDRFACYMVEEDAEYNFCENCFENYSHNGFQFSLHGSPKVTINIEDNYVGAPADDIEMDVRGIARFRPQPKKTTTFGKIIVNANRNMFAGEPDRVAFCQYKDGDIVLTEKNTPTYCLNGRISTLEIVDSTTSVVEE